MVSKLFLFPAVAMSTILSTPVRPVVYHPFVDVFRANLRVPRVVIFEDNDDDDEKDEDKQKVFGELFDVMDFDAVFDELDFAEEFEDLTPENGAAALSKLKTIVESCTSEAQQLCSALDMDIGEVMDNMLSVHTAATDAFFFNGNGEPGNSIASIMAMQGQLKAQTKLMKKCFNILGKEAARDGTCMLRMLNKGDIEAGADQEQEDPKEQKLNFDEFGFGKVMKTLGMAKKFNDLTAEQGTTAMTKLETVVDSCITEGEQLCRGLDLSEIMDGMRTVHSGSSADDITSILAMEAQTKKMAKCFKALVRNAAVDGECMRTMVREGGVKPPKKNKKKKNKKNKKNKAE